MESEHVHVLAMHARGRYWLACTPKFGTSGFRMHACMLPCFMMSEFSFDIIDLSNAGTLALDFISGTS